MKLTSKQVCPSLHIHVSAIPFGALLMGSCALYCSTYVYVPEPQSLECP